MVIKRLRGLKMQTEKGTRLEIGKRMETNWHWEKGTRLG